MKRNNVNSNLESLLQAAKTHDLPVFMSPHYFYPHDHKLNTHLGPMEDLALNGGVVARQRPITLEGYAGSGADIPERFKKYIEDGETVITSRHVSYAPTNDLVLCCGGAGFKK